MNFTYLCKQNFTSFPPFRQNKYPLALPVDFHFRAVSPNTTSSAQAALMTTCQSLHLLLATRQRVVFLPSPSGKADAQRTDEGSFIIPAIMDSFTQTPHQSPSVTASPQGEALIFAHQHKPILSPQIIWGGAFKKSIVKTLRDLHD